MNGNTKKRHGSQEAALGELIYAAAAPTIEAIARELLSERKGDGPEPTTKKALEDLLQQPSSKSQQQCAAAAFIHGLHRDENLFRTCARGSSKKAIALIDRSIEDTYRHFGIKPGDADFEKIGVLAGVVGSALEELDEAAGRFGSLDTFESDRNGFQRVLGLHKQIVAPLIDPGLQRRKLQELFEAVADLKNEDGPELVGVYGRAREAITQFEAEVDASGPFAHRVFSDLSKSLSTLVEDVYSKSSVTDPGDLRVISGAKKYPLSRLGEELRLAILVENTGPGQAVDAYIDGLEADGVDLSVETIALGALMPGRISASVPATTPANDGHALVTGTLHWKNSDGSSREAPFEAGFEAQRADVDWDCLEQPYDLEPVSTTEELVGRSEILGELRDLALGLRVGNAFVTGQKRVGKTSIALTLRSALGDEDADLVVAYLEAGAFVSPSGAKTVTQMGRSVCEEILASDPRFEGVEIPTFEDTLAPLRSFIGKLRARVPKLRVLVIVDEFDELPLELYRRGPAGDALFLSLRTLAGQPHIGFVFVGGEKMDPIVDAQGDSLNKFRNHPVSYFDRERHWEDFCELVRSPVASWLEITDEAILALFDMTAGHPYFTKMVCAEMFKLMKRRHDAHATGDEIAVAADAAIGGAGTHNFTHFWEDGIVASGEAVEEISIRRRKFLLAYAEAVEAGHRSVEAVRERATIYGLTDVEVRDLVREFARRGVLEVRAGEIHAKVGLFDSWLARYGVRAITTTFSDPDATLHARRRDREEHVDAEELTELVLAWGPYKGSKVTSEEVRAWLNQFDSIRAQRLMFRVLQGIRFYDAGRIRGKLAEAHAIVRHGLTQRLQPGRQKRDDILISYLGEVGKSGVRYARLYADQNGIYSDQVVDHPKLAERLAAGNIQALVLVDDLLGSGDQASDFLNNLDTKVGDLLRKHETKVVFIALCGFAAAQRRVADAIDRLVLPIELHICDTLGEDDRCFSEQSRIFPDAGERAEALGIAESVGKRLQRRQPLGYRNVQGTVVFEDSCPNSTLPILWDSRGNWRPLFPRHHALS
jgi:hypothetical protein